MDTLLKGGTVVTAEGSFPANVGITGGRITELLDPACVPQANEIIDVTGLHILPGAIDEHVHFNDPGTTFREDFTHGTAACAVGGITTAIAMPTNVPLILNREALQVTLDTYAGRGYVDYAVHGGLDASNLDTVEDLWCNTGVAAIKMFMCESSPDMGWVRDDLLYSTLELLAKHDGVAIIHAENNEIISLHEKRMHDAGRIDPIAHSHSRPKFAEVEAMRRALYFIECTGVTAVFPHVSTAEGLRLIREAQQAGVKIYAESCAQYFTFIDEDLNRFGPYLKFTPPMHDRENRDEMLELLKAGYVNTIATDHSPYTIEEKEQGKDNIWLAPNGVPGLEVLLPTMLNLVSEGWLTLEKVVEMTSKTPAEIYHLPHKGRIAIGYDADLVLVDMQKTMPYQVAHIQSKNKWSPFLGRTFKGWPVRTMVRGETVALNNQLVGKQGHGQYVPCPKREA